MKMFRLFVVVPGLVVGLGLFPSSSRCALLPVSNPSFESPAVGDGDYTYGVTDWVGDRIGVDDFTAGSSAFVEGYDDGDDQNILFVQDGHSATHNIGTILANNQYTLSVDVGRRNDFGDGATYTIALSANGTTVVSEVRDETEMQLGHFERRSISFTSPVSGGVVGQTLAIEFEAVDGQANFDDVELDATPVPEPANLLFLAVIALLARRR